MNEREAIQYIQRVESAFCLMKSTSRPDDLWAKAIPLTAEAGYLLPICELHADDSELIDMLGRWREESAHVYPTQFPVTFDGTKRWLRRCLLDTPDRILFLIVDSMGKPLGHVGFASAMNEQGVMELDNLLRGSPRGHREIVRLAVEALMQWAQETIRPEGFYLRVLSSLKHVVKLDQRLGFVGTQRIPLRKHVESDRISFEECDPKDTEEPDEWFVKMEYQSNRQAGAAEISNGAGTELKSETTARSARASALRMVHRAKASHIGSALSMIDLLAVLYDGVLHVDSANPELETRDRLIVSKGHAAVGLYAVLAEAGFITREELDSYGENGSRLLGHASHHVPGIEMSTGALGHGLPVGCGLAIGFPESRIVVITGDGEMGEGSNWEAILFAAHHDLTNLTLIIDANRIQGTGDVEDVLSLAPLPEKLASFGWNVLEIDGHDHRAIRLALAKRFASRKPVAVIAHTVKGKGVDFMENSLDWHYKCPNDDQIADALFQVAS